MLAAIDLESDWRKKQAADQWAASKEQEAMKEMLLMEKEMAEAVEHANRSGRRL